MYFYFTDPVHIAEQRLHLLNSDQHRPIVPSPIQESAISPTKSVLDALKEISRKRIHNQVELSTLTLVNFYF